MQEIAGIKRLFREIAEENEEKNERESPVPKFPAQVPQVGLMERSDDDLRHEPIATGSEIEDDRPRPGQV